MTGVAVDRGTGAGRPHVTTPTDETDEQLARRASGGSAAAFETLARRYQATLLRYLLARCGHDRHAAEDAVQEAFLKMFRSIDRYDPGRSFRTWAFAIAYRCRVDAGRRRRPGAEADRPAAESRPDADPARRAADDEAGHHLWETARRLLPSDGFTAVWMYYAEDLPSAEIAAVLGRSDAWVRTALHRARKTLAGHLRPHGEGVA